MKLSLKCKWRAVCVGICCRPVMSYFSLNRVFCYTRSLWTCGSDLWLGEEQWDGSFANRDGGCRHQDPEEEPQWILPSCRRLVRASVMLKLSFVFSPLCLVLVFMCEYFWIQSEFLSTLSQFHQSLLCQLCYEDSTVQTHFSWCTNENKILKITL